MMSIGVYRLLQLALGAKPQSEFLKPVNPVEFSSSDA